MNYDDTCWGTPLERIDDDFWSKLVYINPSGLTKQGDRVYLRVFFDAATACWTGEWDWDMDNNPMGVEILSEGLPKLPDWYAGDTHYHSNYTDNIIEFGSPISAAIAAGSAIGLSWTTVTDHSFDLNETKWNKFKSECNSFSSSTFRCLIGEEISVYIPGTLSYNHYLGYNLNTFIPGGEWEAIDSDTTSDYTPSQVVSMVNSQIGGFGYFAHPMHGDEFRNPVRDEDYSLPFTGLQIWNYADYVNYPNELQQGLDKWKELLLNGRHVFIEGGSDAHGDFNERYGKVRTYVYSPSGLTETGILNALRNGSSIMTDGPLVIFTANGANIGSTVTVAQNGDINLNIQGASSQEFGTTISYKVFGGIIGGLETQVRSGSFTANPTGSKPETLNMGTDCNNQKCYIRIEATTETGKKAYTNPIWVEISEVTIGNFTFSEASDSGDSPSDRPYNVQLRISTGTVSSLSIQSIAQISESASFVNGSTGKGREADKTRTYPAEKAGYVGQGSAGNKTFNLTITNASELIGYVAPGTKVEEKILNVTGYVAPGKEVEKKKAKKEGNVSAQILCTNAYIYDTYISNGVDSDGDGYYESFDIEIDADVAGGATASVKARIVASTGQSWWTGVWEIHGTETYDNYFVHFDMSQFNFASPQSVTFTIYLYRSDGTNTGSSDSVTARIDNPKPPCEKSYIYDTYVRSAVDSDGDGYYEGFDIEIDADTTGDFSCDVKARIVASTGQEWWTPAWSIYDEYYTDNYFMHFDMSDFGFTSPRQVTLTVYLYTSDGINTGSSDSVTAKVDAFIPYLYKIYVSNGADGDGDGYYESFDIEIDADIGGFLTSDVKAYIAASTGQSWWTGVWSIYDEYTYDNYFVHFRMEDFGLASPQEVSFSVYLYLSDGSNTGSYRTINAKVDSPFVRGVHAARVYWRYGSPAIDAGSNDGSAEMSGSVDAPSSIWSASIPPPGDAREGQTLYWRVYATDNAAASAWSPSYTGGIILDDDATPPTISNVQVSEYNGNGDGVISDREQVKISRSAYDASGISSTSITIDGAQASVQGSYYAVAGPFTAGEHSYRIIAYDGDNTPAYSERAGSFTVISSDTTPPVVQSVWHSPAAPSASDVITVYASIFDESEVSAALHYSLDGTTWNSKPMAIYASGSYTALQSPAKKLVIKQKKGKKIPKGDIERAKGREIKEIPKLGYKVVEAENPEKFKKEIERHPDIEHMQEAVLHSLLFDSYYQEQLNLKAIHAEEAWKYTLGEGVVVAVLDTGVNYVHPDLNDNYAGGYDWVNNDADANDDNGHGTHVAGIIAAEMNGEGIVGVAPKAKILAEKVLDSTGVGYDYDVASAIVHAADSGAAVISMSFGGAYSKVIEDAVEYAYSKGVLLVAAAGNNREAFYIRLR